MAKPDKVLVAGSRGYWSDFTVQRIISARHVVRGLYLSPRCSQKAQHRPFKVDYHTNPQNSVSASQLGMNPKQKHCCGVRLYQVGEMRFSQLKRTARMSTPRYFHARLTNGCISIRRWVVQLPMADVGSLPATPLYLLSRDNLLFMRSNDSL